MKIKIKIVDYGKAPIYKTKGAACADCYSNKCMVIPKGQRALIPLGFAIELPEDYEAIIRPRSGLSKKGIDVITGTIDCDYRGEVSANVINNTDADYFIKVGDRICQMKIQKAKQFKFEIVEELSKTDRKGGFGSTGLN